MRWLSIALLWLTASTASAQLAEGQRFLQQADFTRAVRAFDRAERGAHLTRDELVGIYEGRAMARWAQGNERQAERDLVALAEIDAHHAFPPEAPPELGEAFAEAARAGGLELEISFADGAGATTIRVDVHRDAAGLVRTLRTHVRTEGGAWTTSEASTIPVAVADGAVVHAWVEAIGPGGAVVGATGSESAPIVHGGGPEPAVTAPVVATAPQSSIFVDEQPTHDDSGLWIGLGIGIGVAVIAAVVIGVAVGVGQGPSDQTQPGAPVVRF